MKRPVRPIALVILTLCMIYPGVTMLYQGLYPTIAGEQFMLVSRLGPWMDLAHRMNIPVWVVLLAKTGIGAAWVFGVLGLWAGDGRALPLVALGALGSLLYPVGPTVMGIIGLVVLFAFRETDEVVPA